MSATLRSGDPVVMKEYTPSSGNVAAGTIVLLGNTAGVGNGIAPAKIENNEQGSLAVGGGIYDIECAGAYNQGDLVYWDGSQATTTSTNNSLLGPLMEDSTANTDAKVFHWPVYPPA